MWSRKNKLALCWHCGPNEPGWHRGIANGMATRPPRLYDGVDRRRSRAPLRLGARRRRCELLRIQHVSLLSLMHVSLSTVDTTPRQARIHRPIVISFSLIHSIVFAHNATLRVPRPNKPLPVVLVIDCDLRPRVEKATHALYIFSPTLAPHD